MARLNVSRLIEVQSFSDTAKAVKPVSREFLERLAVDPLVQDWLISVSDLEHTRVTYLDYFGRFINWTGWTPEKIVELKRGAMKQGEPISDVERQIKRFNETLRIMGYAGKTRSKAIASVYSFIQSKGYMIPKRLVRMDKADKFTMRVPEREEIELFLQYAKGLERKLLYTLITETPCRPRVFPALHWNWLEPDWWSKDVVHISLPKEFRPSNTGGPKKFEPICFIGPRAIKLLKQLREAKIKSGKIPMETDRILSLTYPAMTVAIRRDYETLVKLGLIRPSRRDEEGKLTEQAISAKSWRKYHFNVIDAIPDICPELRSMLKGRDLKTERYYSKENVKQLCEVYRTKIYSKLWTSQILVPEELKAVHKKLEQMEKIISALQAASGDKVRVEET